MSGFDNYTDDVDITLELGATGGEGPDLTGYPLLVYAPSQHGPGVRLNDNLALVTDIADAYAMESSIHGLAHLFGTTEAHIRQALAYAAATGKSP